VALQGDPFVGDERGVERTEEAEEEAEEGRKTAIGLESFY